MWFIFALISGVFFAINSLMMRRYAKEHEDMWIFSFSFSLFCSIILLPFFIYEFKLTNTAVFWGGVVLIGTVVVINNLMGFTASKLLGPSTQNIIGKFKLIWLVITGLILFSEVLTLTKIIGIILIISASLLVIDYKSWKVSRKGIILVFVGTLTSTLYAIIIKKLIVLSGPLTLTFLVFFIPMLLNAIVIPNFIKRVKKEYSKVSNIKALFFIGLAGSVANLALIKALSYSELSGVYLIMEASLIVIIFGEHFVLKEKERVLLKALAVCLAIVGALLVRGIL